MNRRRILDIVHQLDLLELLTDSHKQGHTMVAVLHDLNHTVCFASHLIVMIDGKVVAQGRPFVVITENLIEEVFS